LKRTAEPIQRVGLIANSAKRSCAEVVARAARVVRSAGRKLFVDADTARFTRIQATLCPDAATLAARVDLLLVFGGDGTMLRLAREIAGSHTPMLGINIGGLGFLTAVSSEDLEPALRHVWAGQFKFELRALIEAIGDAPDHPLCQTALNDIVISRGVIPRLIELDVDVDGEPLTRYRCDGLIISSPTGSTAYSLAAGGALVSPTAEVFALTPISPHTLSNRSLILPLTSCIRIRAISPRPRTVLSADGQVIRQLASGEAVIVRRSRRTVRLMHLADSSFFEALRRKLHWRGANF